MQMERRNTEQLTYIEGPSIQNACKNPFQGANDN